MDFHTLSVTAGHHTDPLGAVMPPIYATSTYRQHAPGVHTGYEYSRAQNPTREALERAIATLEGGRQGYAFSSGLAAIATVLDLLPAGSHIVALDDLYGGTKRLFERVRHVSADLSVSYVPSDDLSAIEAAIRPNSRLLWVETPSNPLNKLADLSALAQLAQNYQLLSVADNTFASPIQQQPLLWGFDIVIHSATKYLNGHSDVIAGVAAVNNHRSELAEKLAFLHNATGAILDPFSSFLVLRGIKTLALRMEQHANNALLIAQWLEQHPRVEQVLYPGLHSHPQHVLAQRQMRGFGGMIAFYLHGKENDVQHVLAKSQLFTLAESLGGVESLVCVPAAMTHATLSPTQRSTLGITPTLIRLSVGIEHAQALIQDLDHMLT